MKKTLFALLNGLLRRRGLTIAPLRDDPRPYTTQEGLANARRVVSSVGTVVDLGASNGAWSERAMRIFPEANYLLFEPLQERLAALEALRARHANVQFVMAVAGARPGRVALEVAKDLDGSSVRAAAGGTSRDVPVVTVDDEIRTRRLPGPYLLKFDTHGYEAPILEGAAETLRRTSLIVMEVYNFNVSPTALRFPAMCLHLEQRGFRCYGIVDPLWRKKDAAFWQMDMLFCRAEADVFRSETYA